MINTITKPLNGYQYLKGIFAAYKIDFEKVIS